MNAKIENPRGIRVLLADDHPVVRAGIRGILAAERDIALVGEATDGNAARHLCLELAPDVLLLDLNMPGPPPAQTVAFLHQECPRVKVLVLTAYEDDMYVRSLISAGAVGYVLKDETPEAVVRAIHTVVNGDTWYSQPVVEKLAQWEASEHAVKDEAHLTPREQELLNLMALGLDNVRIANTLGLAEQTVRNQVSKIYVKLNVATRAEAIVWARERGLGK